MFSTKPSLILFSLLFSFLFFHESEAQSDNELLAKAHMLSKKYIITDGHVDLPYRLRVTNFRLEKEFLGIPIYEKEGDFDYVKAKAGGLDVPFMSIYIPSKYQKQGGAKELADSLIDMMHGIITEHPTKFGHGRTVAEVESNFEKGVISLPMGMENGAPVGDDLSNISHFHSRGIRYITLTHSRDNQICDSSYDTTGTWKGLSPFGKKVVNEMNRVGVMVDISHVSDNTFNQVMDLTDVPVIASHSSCRAFTPGFERNMSDAMLKRLKKNGGVIQINFGTTFLSGDLTKDFGKKRGDLYEIFNKKGITFRDPAATKIIADFEKKNDGLYADVELVADHIDHVVKIAGIDHVGLGSDFDGVGDSLPTGLKDVSQYPNLIYELLKRGYSDADIAKICFKNVFRVWQAVEAAAK